MVLNMLSTGTMIRLGKTFGNLMVDLRATNSKLRRRAIRIVQEATGLDEAAAADVLRRSGDESEDGNRRRPRRHRSRSGP